MLANKVMGATSAAPDLNYIEDVFSTYLYTGTGATQTITNGIDLAGKGGLTWIKARTQPSFASNHTLFDTVRGTGKQLFSDLTSAQATDNTSLTAFNGTGFTLGTDSTGTVNYSGHTFASWTFRKQPKFFDVVTWTGNDTVRTIAHNLGSVPGCIIVKDITNGGSWWVYHTSLGNTKYLNLNATSAAGTFSGTWNDTSPTSTVFTLGTSATVNSSASTYVAYLFAHDAGGFGLSGNENVVSCGSYTGNGSTAGPEINLGYEPQWVMIKSASAAGPWLMLDTMRGFIVGDGNTGVAGSADARLFANLSSEEDSGYNRVDPTSTGFKITSTASEDNTNGVTYIYIAIRRGPMAVPTLATTVFNSVARTGTGGTATVEPGFVTDLIIDQRRSAGGDGGVAWDRLRGAERYLFTRTTAAQGTTSNSLTSFANMNGVTVGADSGQVINVSGVPWINYMFRRAPSFFDEVCYTGTATYSPKNHNLAVAPELVIQKGRSVADAWYVTVFPANKYGVLNNTGAFAAAGQTQPTATQFWPDIDTSGVNYVAYLFASAPGVSKVGSYTGTGTTQAIACGFTAGARFVMIKRTDNTGNWYVWDSARGITAGNDPYLWLNSLNAEVTDTDYIDPSSAGFEISSTAPAEINASGGSYIFLAIA